MTPKKIIPLAFVLLFNLWLIKIFEFSFLIALTVVLASFFIYLTIQTNKKNYFVLSILFIFVLSMFQYETSSINSLTFLNENEKTEQRQKMTGYPRSLFRFANWLEQRKEALVFYKIEENFSEVIDPNLYFFANHPRERVGVSESEKFPYILLPFLVLGLLSIKKEDLKILLLSFSPIVLISLIGNSNPAGPFSLFPFFASYTAVGLKPVFENKKYLFIFLLIFTLVFIQAVSYETY